MAAILVLCKRRSMQVLFIAQALFWCGTMVGVTLTALIGAQLAPYAALATLPMGLLVLGTLVSTQPLSRLMQRQGRRFGLMLGAACGIVGGCVGAYGIYVDSFLIFSTGALIIGVHNASAQYYRFAAIDAAPAELHGTAASLTMAGAVLAALVGPTLALWSKDLSVIPFLGAYWVVAGLAACGFLVLSALPDARKPSKEQTSEPMPAAEPIETPSARELLGRPGVRQAITLTASGHGLMVLIMTATPLAMAYCALPVTDTAVVIQWHVLGMFLPFFVTGALTDRIGPERVGQLGVLILALSTVVSMSSDTMPFFLVGSMLLGVGWNLMMISGTTLLTRHHRAAEKGRAQGLMELINGAIAAIGSFGAGILLSGVGWGAVNLGGLLLVMGVAAMMIHRARQRLNMAEQG